MTDPLLYVVIITCPMLSNPVLLCFNHMPTPAEGGERLREFRGGEFLALGLVGVLSKFTDEQVAAMEARARKGSLDVSMSLNASAITGLQFTVQIVRNPQ